MEGWQWRVQKGACAGVASVCMDMPVRATACSLEHA